jgi:hypothetical protein
MKNNLRSFASILILFSALFLQACTTANYGLAPTNVQGRKDTLKFRMYVGGFSGGDTADNAVKPDIEAYQTKNGFRSYKITDRQYNIAPSYFEYTVQFNR